MTNNPQRGGRYVLDPVTGRPVPAARTTPAMPPPMPPPPAVADPGEAAGTVLAETAEQPTAPAARRRRHPQE